jgi:hypothetical protein
MKIKDNIKIRALIFFCFMISLYSSGQTLGRTNIGSFGGSISRPGITLQSCGGQGSSTETNGTGNITLRQGFIQPYSIQQLQDEIGVTLYPNPTNGDFSFETSLEETESFTYTVKDVNDKIILSGEGKGKETKSANLAGVSSGTYYLTIDAEKGTALSKIVVIN